MTGVQTCALPILRYLRTLTTDEQMRTILAREFLQLFKTALDQRRKKDPIALPEPE